jgi:hypothetical protein
VTVETQVLVRRVPLVRQTRMSVERRMVRVVVMLRDMGPPCCMRLHARGGDEKACWWARVDPRRCMPWGTARVGLGDAFRCYGFLGEKELPHLANAAQEGRPRTRRFRCSWIRHEVLLEVVVCTKAYPPTVYQLDVGCKAGDLFSGDGVAGF